MRLPQSHLHCFVTPADLVDETACRQVLSPEELGKADAFRFLRDRMLSLAARAQVRWLLSRYTGLTPEKILFSVDEKGKPRVMAGTPGEDIRFNLSHSSGLVVTAFCRGISVGADVEGLDRAADLQIAKRFFTEAEYRRIMVAPEAERQSVFLRLWTLKEAWAKACGRGLAAGLDRICFDLSSLGALSYRLEGSEDVRDWQFFQFEPVPGTIAALAAAAKQPLSLAVFRCLPFEGIAPLEPSVIATPDFPGR